MQWEKVNNSSSYNQQGIVRCSNSNHIIGGVRVLSCLCVFFLPGPLPPLVWLLLRLNTEGGWVFCFGVPWFEMKAVKLSRVNSNFFPPSIGVPERHTNHFILYALLFHFNCSYVLLLFYFIAQLAEFIYAV